MRRSEFTEQQIVFAPKHAETGGGGRGGVMIDPEKALSMTPVRPIPQARKK